MSSEHWQRVKELFAAALETEPSHRPAFLDRACVDDLSLRSELEGLLAAGEEAGTGFLNHSAVAVELSSNPSAGARIGPYEMVEEIGVGGMGEVWLAEQKEPVRRRVAVKLVKAGMNTREVMARFESERQALALMDHPAIAKVFEAGSTPQGAPYFVMEYVDGVPITVYCDNHRLRTRERLELFMHVCEGVQHAHQKAIIHRDLKPSNILVTEVDGRAAPKIIDFGVAKALTQRLTTDTKMFTRVGVLVGTPEYMSPEQANSSGEDIDTRTDVYSLGIIFYELLAGVPPIEVRKIAFEEFLRRLREDEPPKPSTKIRTQDPATSTEVAHRRQTEPLTLAKQMRGELDSIALKALEKDRSRRYASPSDLAADIGRYLNNEAVLAVPPSAAYRARKFARRYRAALVTSCAFALVLIVAAAVSIRQGVRANREAAVAQAVNDFLQNDLLAQASAANQSGPSVQRRSGSDFPANPDPDLKVRTTLDRAAARIAGKFDRQPEVEAAIRDTIGQTYMDLGLYPEARKQLERALDLHRTVLGAENPKTLNTMSLLGRTAFLQGEHAQAEAFHRRTLEIRRRVLGAEHPDTLSSMNGLALDYQWEGKYAQSEVLHSQTVEISRRVLGPEHPDTLNFMNSLAIVYEKQGKYAQAEALYSQTLEIQRRVLGPEHSDTLISMNGLANVYQWEGKYAQSEALHSQTVEISRRVLGPEHPYTLSFLSHFAWMYQRQGKYASAERYAKQALAGRRHAHPEQPDTMAESAADLALAYLSEGKFAESEPLAREAMEIDRKKRTDDWQGFRAESLLGASLAGQKKYAEAEPLLLEGYQGMLARKDRMEVPNRYHLDRAREWIVQLYQAWGKREKAAEWRESEIHEGGLPLNAIFTAARIPYDESRAYDTLVGNSLPFAFGKLLADVGFPH
jgi:eukaryotic-like serine/threonine-protein kinase